MGVLFIKIDITPLSNHGIKIYNGGSMQLILNKDLINKKDNREKSAIVIISTRKELKDKISEYVRLADIKNIKEIDDDIFSTASILIPDNVKGIIIDINENHDINIILDLMKVHTPRDCWCILVGDIDSISIAQQFIERGILYLHIQSQLADLTQNLLKGIQIESDRKAFFISILGCRGGIGTTLLSYQLAHVITQIKKSPTLLLQGNQGSQDLDLITEKKMGEDITDYQKNFDLMRGNERKLSEVNEHNNKKHNFIIFDQPIHNARKEKTLDYISNSNCIILLIDHSMMSVRVAKEFIDTLERFKRDNRQAIRLFICLNENRPITKDMLTTSDIQSLLGHSIDTAIPYINNAKKSLNSPDYFGRKKTKVVELAKQSLGININLSSHTNMWIREKLNKLFK